MGRRRNNKLCAICESPKAISRFGGMACRACGAFFRRLVLNNRKYQCDCEVKLQRIVESSSAKKLRILKCRGCRMRECLDAGMKEEFVKKSEEMRLIKMEDTDAKSYIFLKKLLDIEEKANHVFLNVFGFPNSFVDHFNSFEELIQSKDNLLAHAEFYKSQSITFFGNEKFFDKEKFEENLVKYDTFHTEPLPLTKTLLIAIDIAKILPAFSRLNLNDQMVAVSNFAEAAGFLINRFNSMKLNSETELMEIIDYPFVKLYNLRSNYEEPVIKNLSEAIFGLSMKYFLQIAPSREEFVFILSLLFTNSAIPSLSEYGQGIMNEETEKCAKILLRFQQTKFGDQKGALRYSECLQLLWNTIYTTQKHKELVAYIDTISEQGSFSAVMPKILRPLML